MGKKKVQQNIQEPEEEKVEDINLEDAVQDGEGRPDPEQISDDFVNTEAEEQAIDNGLEEGVEEEKSPEILALEEEKKNLVERMSRLQADFDNYRRRSQLEKEDLKARSNENLITQFLPIMDNFERALENGGTNEESFFQGVALIYRQMLNFLENEGVISFDPMGEVFDHNKHHAVIKEPADNTEEDTIIQVLQKGYMYKDRVLRPAMVKVAE